MLHRKYRSKAALSVSLALWLSCGPGQHSNRTDWRDGRLSVDVKFADATTVLVGLPTKVQILDTRGIPGRRHAGRDKAMGPHSIQRCGIEVDVKLWIKGPLKTAPNTVQFSALSWTDCAIWKPHEYYVFFLTSSDGGLIALDNLLGREIALKLFPSGEERGWRQLDDGRMKLAYLILRSRTESWYVDTVELFQQADDPVLLLFSKEGQGTRFYINLLKLIRAVEIDSDRRGKRAITVYAARLGWCRSTAKKVLKENSVALDSTAVFWYSADKDYSSELDKLAIESCSESKSKREAARRKLKGEFNLNWDVECPVCDVLPAQGR